MSKVVYEAKKSGDNYSIVKFRIRRCNEWCNHRIPVAHRNVTSGAIFQKFQRWHYTDNGELVSIELSKQLNAL